MKRNCACESVTNVADVTATSCGWRRAAGPMPGSPRGSACTPTRSAGSSSERCARRPRHYPRKHRRRSLGEQSWMMTRLPRGPHRDDETKSRHRTARGAWLDPRRDRIARGDAPQVDRPHNPSGNSLAVHVRGAGEAVNRIGDEQVGPGEAAQALDQFIARVIEEAKGHGNFDASLLDILTSHIVKEGRQKMRQRAPPPKSRRLPCCRRCAKGSRTTGHPTRYVLAVKNSFEMLG